MIRENKCWNNLVDNTVFNSANYNNNFKNNCINMITELSNKCNNYIDDTEVNSINDLTTKNTLPNLRDICNSQYYNNLSLDEKMNFLLDKYYYVCCSNNKCDSNSVPKFCEEDCLIILNELSEIISTQEGKTKEEIITNDDNIKLYYQNV